MKISVLTPCYNSGKYLKKSIESVLDQDYKNWEHIVVDGASTDNTIDILKSYSHLNWVSEPDSGQSDAMNKTFEKCTGDIIVYLNADDYFYKGAFREIIESFKLNENIDIIVGDLETKRNDKYVLSDNATISWKDLSIIKGRFPLNPVSYFYKREVQIGVGKFPVKEHYTMDYWFLLRAFYLYKPLKIDKVLGCFVFDGENKTAIIQDGFSIQVPHAIKFCLKYTPFRLPYVYLSLLLNPRNKSNSAIVLKKMKKKINKFKLKVKI